eukprot:7726911-Ditylum_brightwellii.AAC.1
MQINIVEGRFKTHRIMSVTTVLNGGNLRLGERMLENTILYLTPPIEMQCGQYRIIHLTTCVVNIGMVGVTPN